MPLTTLDEEKHKERNNRIKSEKRIPTWLAVLILFAIGITICLVGSYVLSIT